MVLAHPLRDDLACGKVFDGRQIPDCAPVIDAAQITAPYLVWVGNGLVVQPVVVGVMGCGDGAVAFDVSPGRTQIEFRHHPLSTFVIDPQMDRNPTMTVRWMRSMDRLNLPLECPVFEGLLSLAIDVLAVNSQRLSTERFVLGSTNYFDFFGSVKNRV
jgi:hypothetical protein